MSNFKRQVLQRLTNLENDFKEREKLKEEVQDIKKLLLKLNSTIDALVDKNSSITRDSTIFENHQMLLIDAELDGKLVYFLLCTVYCLFSITNGLSINNIFD